MLRLYSIIYLCSILLQAKLAVSSAEATSFTWGSTKIRGANIGGWLVLEPWITPSIFDDYPSPLGIVDEYTLGERLGRGEALNILKKHWNTWATIDDFRKLCAAGFNVVRIPIGYWAFETFGRPFVLGAAEYLDKAIQWARQTDLKVIIDLHGAPGSQNGFDNSGEKMAHPQWETGDNISKTLEILGIIARKYGQSTYRDAVIGIELLNEPASWDLDMDTARQFYRDAFNTIRTTTDIVVILQDGFLPPSSYNGFLSPSDHNAQNVAIDHHEYQVFSDGELAMPQWQHRQTVCNRAKLFGGADKWSFIGEWTAAMTDCARGLNGYGVGARYDGSIGGSKAVGSCSNISDIGSWPAWYRDDIRGFIEAQLDTYEAVTNGWVFWNFKTESSGEWDLFRLLDAGIFPQPLSARKFPPVCSNL